jgi:hypothetical protein
MAGVGLVRNMMVAPGGHHPVSPIPEVPAFQEISFMALFQQIPGRAHSWSVPGDRPRIGGKAVLAKDNRIARAGIHGEEPPW